MFRSLRGNSRFRRREDGAAAVEFAIILPVLALLILGGMDMAHMYYIKYVITNASREGARYAAKYTYPPTDTSSTAISNYVKTKLNYQSFNFSNFNVTGNVTGSFPNKIATVTVSADKYWWMLGSLLGNPKHLTATTAMAVEGP
jgi:Flp pilus assembly protein TadG